MFEVAEVGHEVSKEDYAAEMPAIRVDLLNTQFDLREAPFPVLIFIAGDDHEGCEELIDLINEWLDARYVHTHVFEKPTGEERQRPRFWRYWRSLPPRGQISLYRGAWAIDALAERYFKRSDETEFDHFLDGIQSFETMLAADGALILKFWIHLPKKVLGKRLKKARKDRRRGWRVNEEDWQIFEHYDSLRPLAEHYLSRTSTTEAPWMVVEGTDRRYRDLTVAKTIATALKTRLEQPAAPSPCGVATLESASGVLDAVDLSASLPEDEYRERLGELQARLSRLSDRARRKRRSSVLAFEGWDAAGKGGTIRRLTGAMVAANYRVIPIAAPTDEEKAHHYLWRFWRHLPRAGHMLLFDRSWYGRVLVERVEGFAREDEWRRAYSEINEFEQELVEFGTPVIKFWLHIDPDEQLRRLKEREATPYKKYKLTEEDYRNREKWPAYVSAVNEMIARTSTDLAPWHVVAANDKRWARIQVLQTVCDRLEAAL